MTIKGISFCRRQANFDRETYRVTERLSPHWLQNLKGDSAAMGELRSFIGGHDLGLDLSRMDDHEVILQFIHLLDVKSLCRCDATKDGEAENRRTGRDRTQSAAESVLRVLTAGDRQFSLEGHTLRVIRAEEWRGMREDGRYQIVPVAEAQQLILKLASMPAIEPEAKTAWRKASALLAEPGVGRFERGLLLLRVVPRRNFKSPSAEPAITPSQLAKLAGVAEPVIEKVNPEIVAVVQDLDTSDDGFVHETEPSGDEVGSDASDSPDGTGSV